MQKRRRHSAELKFRVALEALREQETLAQIASKYAVSPQQISTWKKQLKSSGSEVFRSKAIHQSRYSQSQVDNLYRKIGELEMQLDWLKKGTEQMSLSQNYLSDQGAQDLSLFA